MEKRFQGGFQTIGTHYMAQKFLQEPALMIFEKAQNWNVILYALSILMGLQLYLW